MWGVATTVFFLFNVLPGDAAQMTLGQRSDISSLEAVKKELGLDKPLVSQYFLYINDISPIGIHNVDTGNQRKYGGFASQISSENELRLKQPYLRRSFQNKNTVNAIISKALIGTSVLALVSMAFATIIGVLLGGIASYRKKTITDQLISYISIIGISIPSYFASIIIAYIFGYLLHDITGLNLTGSLYEYDFDKGQILNLSNLILPAITLGIRPLAIIVQLSRNSFIEGWESEYALTAKAKGLNDKQIFFRHILKNGLSPVLTAVSGWLASLLAGAVFVEYIFGWHGLGKITVDALLTFDLPVVMGSVLVVGSIFIVINILVDIIYGMLDPRVVIGK